MAKAKRRKPARRRKAAPGGSVGAMLKRISRMFNIPRQAIVVLAPSRRRVGPNAKLARLRAAWD